MADSARFTRLLGTLIVPALMACAGGTPGKGTVNASGSGVDAAIPPGGFFPDGGLPLTVQEALFPAVAGRDQTQYSLPVAATGIDRADEPVTTGVPLPASWQVSAESPQVSLAGGPTIGQFECEAHWPDGSCKWLLVNTQIPSLAAGQTATFSLVRGAGNFGGPNLATDSSAGNPNTGTITVATGAATFTIRKAGFNLFDSVDVGGTLLVSPGTSDGIVVTGPVHPATTCQSPPTDCTTPYRSADDSASTAVIERNGPATTIVRADGALEDGSGNAYLRFTVRLQFYAGKSYVSVKTILRNADESTGTGDFASAYKGFDSYEARVRLTGVTSPIATFATNSAPATHALVGSEDAYLYQAYSTMMQSDNFDAYDFIPWVARTGSQPSGDYNYAQDGYQVVHGSTGSRVTDASGGDQAYHDGWADLADASGKGVTIGVMYMSAFWPKSLQFMGGGADVRIGLFPDQQLMNQAPSGAIPYYQAWPQYKIDDVYFNFHAGSLSSPGNEFLKYQRFLLARADWSHYNAANVLPVALMDPAEEDQYYRDIAAAANPPVVSQERACCVTDWNPTVRYRYGWSGPGIGNQADFRWAYLLQFFSRGLTGRYLWAQFFNRFIMESAYPRADFAGGWKGHMGVGDLNALGFPSGVASANSTLTTFQQWVEDLHDHTYGMLDWYLFTGDRTYLDFIKQAFTDRYFNFRLPLLKPLSQCLTGGGCMSIQREIGIKIIHAARMEEFFRSIGDAENADNAVTLANNAFTLMTPDLEVSGTGTSTTFDSTTVPGVTYPTYGTSRTRGMFYADGFGTWDTADPFNVSDLDQANCGTYGTIKLFGPPYPHDPVNPPYQVSMVVQGLYELTRVRGTAWSDYTLARDLALGMAQWAIGESLDTGDWRNSGIRYSIPMNHICPQTGPICECIVGHAFVATVWYHWFFLHDYLGDTSHEGLFERQLQKDIVSSTPNAFLEHSSYGLTNAMYYFKHPEATTVSPSGVVGGRKMQTVDVTASHDASSGEWTLTWTPPAGVQAYLLKHAPGKEIVDWLDFDITQGDDVVVHGTWGIDPATHATWFGSAYAPAQPAPGSSSITLSGLAADEGFMLKAAVTGGGQ